VPRTLPVIDIGPAFDSGEEQARAVGKRIDAACRDRGFFYVTGHGVDPALVAATFAQSKRLFALPEEVKNRWHMSKSPVRRGYEGIGWQTLDPGTPEDLKESFYLGIDRGPDDPFVQAGTPNYGPNQWPDAALLPEFKAVTTAYFQALDGLARRLLGLIALGLDLPRDHFDQYVKNPMTILRLLHYPPQPATAVDNQMGCGAHTDWGGITLLMQDDAGGLQVRDVDDTWIEAQPVPGSFVVNLGDLMARWTNDRYRSTLHRVINAKSGRDRYSIPFFFDIDYHAEVRALPGCHDAANPPRYPAISAGQHIIEMYEKTTGRREERKTS
jgi:isopenicillin N synthase-like dioxygenase